MYATLDPKLFTKQTKNEYAGKVQSKDTICLRWNAELIHFYKNIFWVLKVSILFKCFDNFF